MCSYDSFSRNACSRKSNCKDYSLPSAPHPRFTLGETTALADRITVNPTVTADTSPFLSCCSLPFQLEATALSHELKALANEKAFAFLMKRRLRVGVDFLSFSCLDDRGDTWDNGSYCVSLKHEDASQLMPFLTETLFHALPHPSTVSLKGAPSSFLTVATGKPGEHIPS